MKKVPKKNRWFDQEVEEARERIREDYDKRIQLVATIINKLEKRMVDAEKRMVDAENRADWLESRHQIFNSLKADKHTVAREMGEVEGRLDKLEFAACLPPTKDKPIGKVIAQDEASNVTVDLPGMGYWMKEFWKNPWFTSATSTSTPTPKPMRHSCCEGCLDFPCLECDVCETIDDFRRRVRAAKCNRHTATACTVNSCIECASLWTCTKSRRKPKKCATCKHKRQNSVGTLYCWRKAEGCARWLVLCSSTACDKYEAVEE